MNDNRKKGYITASFLPFCAALFCAALFCAALFCAALLLSGCSQDPIFAAIENEVALEEATMKGNVYSVVEYGGSLYAANGNFYVKRGGAGDWHNISKPSGKLCIELAAGDGIYGRFVEEGALTAFSVRRSDGSAWTEVPITAAVRNIFDDGNGKAYIISSSGDSDSSYSLSELTPDGTGSSGNYPQHFFDAFFDGTAACFVASDGIYEGTPASLTKISGSPGGIKGAVFNAEKGILYAVTGGGTLHYYNSDDGWNTFSGDLGSAECIEYNEHNPEEPMLFVGTSSGYRQVSLNAEGIPESILSLSGNADPAIGSYLVYKMYAFADPSPSGNYVIYASILDNTDAKRSGLWSYYPSSGTWNRE